MTESIAPHSQDTPAIKYQPSMLSLPSSASTVRPEDGPTEPSAALGSQARAGRRRLWFFAALSVVAGVVAAKSFQSPASVTSQVHSGSPGLKHTSSGEVLRWKSRSLTVYIDDSLSRIGPEASAAVTRAFGSWVESDPNLPDLRFDSGDTSAIPKQDGKSTVSYGRIALKGHEQDLAITVSYADDHTGEILEADVVLNSLYAIGVLGEKATTGSVSPRDHERKKDDDHEREKDDDHERGATGQTDAQDCRNRYDVQNLTTHEAGHFFGLGEDAVERKAAMFQVIDECEVHKRALATTDIGAVATLYASAEPPEEIAAGARGCSVALGPTGAAAGWVSLLLASVGLARRRRTR